MPKLVSIVLLAILTTANLIATDSFLLATISVTPQPWDKESNFATLERDVLPQSEMELLAVFLVERTNGERTQAVRRT